MAVVTAGEVLVGSGIVAVVIGASGLMVYYWDGSEVLVQRAGPTLYRADTTSVKLVWNPVTEPGIAGYEVAFGKDPGDYALRLDTASATTTRIHIGDTDGTQDSRFCLTEGTWFTAVRSYSYAYLHSDYSREISFTMGDSMVFEMPPEGWVGEKSADLINWSDTTKGFYREPLETPTFFRYREDTTSD